MILHYCQNSTYFTPLLCSNYYVENRNLNDKTIGQRVADKGGIRIILTCFLCLITSTCTLFLKCCCCASFQNGHKDSNSDLDNMEKQLKILKHYRTGTEGKDKGSSKDMQRREYSAYRSKVQRKNDDEIRRPQKVYKHCKSTLTHGTKNQLAQSNYRRERPSNMHEVDMDADDSDRVYCSPWTRHRHRSGKIYYYNNR